MGRLRFLRVEMGALLSLTILLQMGFLIEVHSPEPSAQVLAFLTFASVVCFTFFMVLRETLIKLNKTAYR